jgi:transposase
MPKVITVRLTQAQREELARLERSRTLAPRVRERLEIIWRSDWGWSSPRIADALGLHEQTVRKYVKAFLVGGVAALADRPRSGRPAQVRAADLDALEQVLDAGAASGRAWTLPQMVRWLATERGVRISRGRVSVLLRRRRFRWKRTKRSVRHKQSDPERQVQAAADLATLRHCRGKRQRA